MSDAPAGPLFAPADPEDERPPQPFRLGGFTRGTTDRWEETFHILGDVPNGALEDLAASITVDATGNIVYARMPVLRFLRAALVPEDETRWDELMRDKARSVSLEQLGTTMLWAAGSATARPTSPLSTSTGGQRDNGDGSSATHSNTTLPAGSNDEARGTGSIGVSPEQSSGTPGL